MDTPRLRLTGVRKSFGRTPVLAGIDLAIAAGAFCVFVGPSGCGKSTLLRLIAGLDEPDGGDIAIDGRVVNALPPAERDVAMVFQSYALYPHMTAHENMAFGLRHRRLARDEIERRIERAARLLQLHGLLARKPRELSGGQRQRVAIGRAIVREPRLFLFDEPLSNLDAALRAATRLELARLHSDLGATMVYVTHDQVEAMTLADTIVLLRPLSDGKGASIAQVGAPLDLYHRPADRFVAGFIGSPAMNFLPAEVTHVHPAGVGLRIGALALTASVRADTVERGAQVTLGIRPEHVRLGGTLQGEAVHVERLGEHSIVHVRIEGGHLLQAKTAREDIARGDSLALDLPAHALHVFDAEGRALTHL